MNDVSYRNLFAEYILPNNNNANDYPIILLSYKKGKEIFDGYIQENYIVLLIKMIV